MKSKDDIMSGYKAIFEDGYRAGRASVVLPHPCDGELYKDWTAADYFAKIAEEHLEVIDAYKEIERNGGRKSALSERVYRPDRRDDGLDELSRMRREDAAGVHAGSKRE